MNALNALSARRTRGTGRPIHAIQIHVVHHRRGEHADHILNVLNAENPRPHIIGEYTTLEGIGRIHRRDHNHGVACHVRQSTTHNDNDGVPMDRGYQHSGCGRRLKAIRMTRRSDGTRFTLLARGTRWTRGACWTRGTCLTLLTIYTSLAGGAGGTRGAGWAGGTRLALLTIYTSLARRTGRTGRTRRTGRARGARGAGGACRTGRTRGTRGAGGAGWTRPAGGPIHTIQIHIVHCRTREHTDNVLDSGQNHHTRPRIIGEHTCLE